MSARLKLIINYLAVGIFVILLGFNLFWSAQLLSHTQARQGLLYWEDLPFSTLYGAPLGWQCGECSVSAFPFYFDCAFWGLIALAIAYVLLKKITYQKFYLRWVVCISVLLFSYLFLSASWFDYLVSMG